MCRMLEQKLAEAKSKKDTLKARAKSAAASKQISEMVQGLNTSNALTAFEKMEEKVIALESESEAVLQVTSATCSVPPHPPFPPRVHPRAPEHCESLHVFSVCVPAQPKRACKKSDVCAYCAPAE